MLCSFGLDFAFCLKSKIHYQFNDNISGKKKKKERKEKKKGREKRKRKKEKRGGRKKGREGNRKD